MPRRGRHHEIWKGKDNLWYRRVVAGNGAKEDVTQGYKTKAEAVKSAYRVNPDFDIWIIDDEGHKNRLRSKDEVMSGPVPFIASEWVE